MGFSADDMANGMGGFPGGGMGGMPGGYTFNMGGGGPGGGMGGMGGIDPNDIFKMFMG